MRNNSQMEESLRGGISEVKKDHNTHNEFLPDYLFICFFVCLFIYFNNKYFKSSCSKFCKQEILIFHESP